MPYRRHNLLTSALCLHNLSGSNLQEMSQIPVVTSPTENIRFSVSIVAFMPGSVKKNIQNTGKGKAIE